MEKPYGVEDQQSYTALLSQNPEDYHGQDRPPATSHRMHRQHKGKQAT
jgi:hypothetical protein